MWRRRRDKFEETLRHMIEAPYKNPADKKSFLENYFHTFLIKGNRKYADWLLEAIKRRMMRSSFITARCPMES